MNQDAKEMRVLTEQALKKKENAEKAKRPAALAKEVARIMKRVETAARRGDDSIQIGEVADDVALVLGGLGFTVKSGKGDEVLNHFDEPTGDFYMVTNICW
mgnify:CR=1 FL=1